MQTPQKILQYLTIRHGDIQDVHLSPLAEFKSFSTVDPADVKASVLQMDRTDHQVWREAVWHLLGENVNHIYQRARCNFIPAQKRNSGPLLQTEISSPYPPLHTHSPLLTLLAL